MLLIKNNLVPTQKFNAIFPSAKSDLNHNNLLIAFLTINAKWRKRPRRDFPSSDVEMNPDEMESDAEMKSDAFHKLRVPTGFENMGHIISRKYQQSRSNESYILEY